jgi:hypothetical protein
VVPPALFDQHQDNGFGVSLPIAKVEITRNIPPTDFVCVGYRQLPKWKHCTFYSFTPQKNMTKGISRVCSNEGCSAQAKGKGKTCKSHGPRKLCTNVGCSKPAWQSGKCSFHSKRCVELGCTNRTQSKARCVAHGANGNCEFCGKGVAKSKDTACTACIKLQPEQSVATIPNDCVERLDGQYCILKAMWREITTNSRLMVPVGLHQIGPSVFAHSSWLKDLELPAGFKFANTGSFQGCVNLETVVFPATYQHSGKHAFDGCTSLRIVQFHPDTTLTCIQVHMFSRCRSLKSIAIPKSVSSIEDNAFAESGLVEVSLSPTVTDCASTAFAGCADLARVELTSSVAIWVDGMNVPPVADPSKRNKLELCDHTVVVHTPAPQHTQYQIEWENAWTIKDVPFLGPADYIPPPKTRHIGANAFFNRLWLTSIDLKTVSWIDDGAFSKCSNLLKLDLSTVEVIGPRAFMGCTSLVEVVYWPGGVGWGITIEEQAFAECSKLPTAVPFPANANVHPTAFTGCLQCAR